MAFASSLNVPALIVEFSLIGIVSEKYSFFEKGADMDMQASEYFSDILLYSSKKYLEMPPRRCENKI